MYNSNVYCGMVCYHRPLALFEEVSRPRILTEEEPLVVNLDHGDLTTKVYMWFVFFVMFKPCVEINGSVNVGGGAQCSA